MTRTLITNMTIDSKLILFISMHPIAKSHVGDCDQEKHNRDCYENDVSHFSPSETEARLKLDQNGHGCAVLGIT